MWPKIYKKYEKIRSLIGEKISKRKNNLIKIKEIENNITVLIDYMSDLPTPCDKCLNYEEIDLYCFKCEGTGLIKNKQLCNWPWQ